MNYSLKLLLLAVLCCTSGCASMLPYGDKYDCPQMEKGQCVPVEAAYTYAVTGNSSQLGGAAVVSPGPDPALAEAIEQYRKAVVKGKPEDIEKRQKELLGIISPGQAGEFSTALDLFKKAVKSKDAGKIAEAEKRLHAIHEQALAAARDSVRLENSITGETARQELLGKYAQGQKSQAVLMPPVVMELYILPYQTEFNTLAGERTMWVTVEPARWVWPDKFTGAQGEEIGSTVRGK